MKITILDYSSSNLNVLAKKLYDFGYNSICSSDIHEIAKSDFILIPGVGHFASSIKQIKTNGLYDVLTEKVMINKIPVIGICLGMQLFTNYSEEGDVEGFGWINARTKRLIYSDNRIKIPHIGWNKIMPNIDKFNLLDEYVNHSFYFIHSYEVVCEDNNDVLALTNYGDNDFCSAIQHENILGFQFHPEKSHKFGMSLLAKAIKFQIENYAK